METNNTQKDSKEALDASRDNELIQVRAIISCPNGDYKKKFRNQFLRKEIEMMIVSFKVFDWLTCSKCGELLKLDLEFNI
ncbi:MAG: hypothetical protein ACXAEX_08775 [Promethearchaeota archaeon]|jgi:hypothetical protein